MIILLRVVSRSAFSPIETETKTLPIFVPFDQGCCCLLKEDPFLSSVFLLQAARGQQSSHTQNFGMARHHEDLRAAKWETRNWSSTQGTSCISHIVFWREREAILHGRVVLLRRLPPHKSTKLCRPRTGRGGGRAMTLPFLRVILSFLWWHWAFGYRWKTSLGYSLASLLVITYILNTEGWSACPDFLSCTQAFLSSLPAAPHQATPCSPLAQAVPTSWCQLSKFFEPSFCTAPAVRRSPLCPDVTLWTPAAFPHFSSFCISKRLHDSLAWYS